MIAFRRTNVYTDGHQVSISSRRSCSLLDMSWYGYVNEYFSYGGHSVSVINKVYKSEIIKRLGLEFDAELKLSEDLAFNLKYLPECCSFVEDFRIEYLRYLTDGSLTRKKLDDYYATETQALRLFKESCPAEYDKIQTFVTHSLVNAALNGMSRLATGVDGEGIYNRIHRIKALMNMNEFRENASRIDVTKENRICIQQTRLAMQGNVYAFFIKYGVWREIKDVLRKIVKRRIVQ